MLKDFGIHKAIVQSNCSDPACQLHLQRVLPWASDSVVALCVEAEMRNGASILRPLVACLEHHH